LSGYAVMLTALVAIGAGYAALAPASNAASSSSNGNAVQAGRLLFLQGCSSCHGLNAQGTNKAPSLIGVGAAAVDFQVGTGRMPAAQQAMAQAPRKKPKYDQPDIDKLAAYVASLSPGPAIPQGVDKYASADLAKGGEMFRENCAQCHQVAGAGGALTYGKYAPTLSAATPKQIYEAMLTGPSNMPVFADGTIAPAEKLDIIRYIRTIKSEPDPGGIGIGRIGPFSEGAVLWIFGITALIGITLWIGDQS
jgi:ubiquinol-cytochrome c reductase cytochrome c subunit